MGRPRKDPEIVKYNQKLARARWKANNQERWLESTLRCQRQRYENDPEFKAYCLDKSAKRYAYQKAATELRKIDV